MGGRTDPNSREEREDQEPVGDQNDDREGAEVLEKHDKISSISWRRKMRESNSP